MGFLDKVRKTLLGAEFSSEDEFFVEDYEDDEVTDEAPRETRRKEKEYTDISDYRHKKTESKYSGSDSKVLNFNADQKDSIVITKPKTIEDAPIVTDYLLNNMACIINLESVEHSDAQRIADFIGGTAYALNCDVERVNNDVFVIAPVTMNIASELKDEIKNSGSILPWIASAFR